MNNTMEFNFDGSDYVAFFKINRDKTVTLTRIEHVTGVAVDIDDINNRDIVDVATETVQEY